MDEASLRLRLATRSIFEACYPGDDFEKAEAERFPRHAIAVAAAQAVLEIKASDLPERRQLSAADVAFEIRYALGQAPASIYVEARSRDISKRDDALGRLVDLIAARFATTEMSRTLRKGWRLSPFEGVANASNR